MDVICPTCSATTAEDAFRCPRCGADLLDALLAFASVFADDQDREEAEGVSPEGSPPQSSRPGVGARPPGPPARATLVHDGSLVMQRLVGIPPPVAEAAFGRWCDRTGGRLRAGGTVLRLAPVAEGPGDGCMRHVDLDLRAPMGAGHGRLELGLVAWSPWRSQLHLRRERLPLRAGAWFRLGHDLLDQVTAAVEGTG